MLLTSPEHYNKVTKREQVLEQIAEAKKSSGGTDANNTIRQAEAMMTMDVSAPWGGALERAASAVKAKVLVVVAKFDHVVTPRPATEFARLMGAELLELDSDCGHLAPSCEDAKVRKAVADFLGRQ